MIQSYFLRHCINMTNIIIKIDFCQNSKIPYKKNYTGFKIVTGSKFLLVSNSGFFKSCPDLRIYFIVRYMILPVLTSDAILCKFLGKCI